MIKYLKLPLEFDIAKLEHEANALLAEQWKGHYNSQQYNGSWEALPLRSVNGDTNNILALDSNNQFADTCFMEQVPYITEVVNSIYCPKMSIRLLNLKAGATVHAHSDDDLYFEQGEARIHVPILTNELVEFYLDEERILMQPGECWYMNLAIKHRLHNGSKTDRVHLVIDCQVNDWLLELFADPRISIKKEVPDFPKRKGSTDEQKAVIEQLRFMNTETSNRMANELEASLQ